jgi:hypothetical protein
VRCVFGDYAIVVEAVLEGHVREHAAARAQECVVDTVHCRSPAKYVRGVIVGTA